MGRIKRIISFQIVLKKAITIIYSQYQIRNTDISDVYEVRVYVFTESYILWGNQF